MSLAALIVQGIVNTWQTEGEFRMEEVKDQTGKVELLRKSSTKHVLSRDGEALELKTVENIDPQTGLPSEADITLSNIDNGQVKSKGHLLFPVPKIRNFPEIADLETQPENSNHGLGTLILNEAIRLATERFPDCPHLGVYDYGLNPKREKSKIYKRAGFVTREEFRTADYSPTARLMYTQASSELGFRVTPTSLKKAADSLTRQLFQEPTDRETQEEFRALYDAMEIPAAERNIPQTKGPGVSLTEEQLKALQDSVERLRFQLEQPQGLTSQQIMNASAELADLAKKKAEFELQNKIAESMKAPASVSWIGLSYSLSDHSEIGPTETFQELIHDSNSDWRNFSRKNFGGQGNQINSALIDFSGSQISNIDLSYRSLRGKDFTRANMKGANLTMSFLPHGVFKNTNLSDVNFSNANLRQADFSGAELPGIGNKGQPADLRGANFTGANLSGADLVNMDLRGVVFSKTNLKGASLKRTNLRGAIIDKTSLIGTSLEGENIDEMTAPDIGQIEEYLKIVRSEPFQKAYELVGVEQIRGFGSRAQGIGFEDPYESPREMASDIDLLIVEESPLIQEQNLQSNTVIDQKDTLRLATNRGLIDLIPEERKIAVDVSDESEFSLPILGDGSFLIYRRAPDNGKLPNLKAVGPACSLFVEEALPDELNTEVSPDNKDSNVVRVTSQHERTEASRDSDYAMPPLNVLADQILADPHDLRQLEIHDLFRDLNLEEDKKAKAEKREPNLPLEYIETPDPDFTNAHLVGANLVGQNLAGANFKNADLRGANLAGANLQTAIMERASLNGANLTNADLSGAELIQVDLSETHLDNTNLTMAELKGANLYKQDLSSCNLGEAKLDGTFVAGAIITSDQLDELRIAGTQFMGGLNVLEDESSYTELTAGKEELSSENLSNEFQAVVDLFQGTEPSAGAETTSQEATSSQLTREVETDPTPLAGEALEQQDQGGTPENDPEAVLDELLQLFEASDIQEDPNIAALDVLLGTKRPDHGPDLSYLSELQLEPARELQLVDLYGGDENWREGYFNG